MFNENSSRDSENQLSLANLLRGNKAQLKNGAECRKRINILMEFKSSLVVKYVYDERWLNSNFISCLR